MNPLRPTTRPLRTKNTWTAASSSSSAMPITSKSSDRSATICCFSMALRTLVEPVAQPGGLLELELAGRLVHPRLELLHDRVGVAVEELEQLLDVLGRTPPWSTSPTHGPEHFSMWNSRHGRPSRWCWPNLLSEQVRIGNVRSSRSSVSRMA